MRLLKVWSVNCRNFSGSISWPEAFMAFKIILKRQIIFSSKPVHEAVKAGFSKNLRAVLPVLDVPPPGRGRMTTSPRVSLIFVCNLTFVSFMICSTELLLVFVILPILTGSLVAMFKKYSNARIRACNGLTPS
eukprot:Pompholyxophrys_sp_v1_NODE_85_length_2191_cov_13.368446.p2 type:complete len:133 gc:universal NODE_85_length_2191_cov_13.368446:1773-1375(-)